MSLYLGASRWITSRDSVGGFGSVSGKDDGAGCNGALPDWPEIIAANKSNSRQPNRNGTALIGLLRKSCSRSDVQSKVIRLVNSMRSICLATAQQDVTDGAHCRRVRVSEKYYTESGNTTPL